MFLPDGEHFFRHLKFVHLNLDSNAPTFLGGYS